MTEQEKFYKAMRDLIEGIMWGISLAGLCAIIVVAWLFLS